MWVRNRHNHLILQRRRTVRETQRKDNQSIMSGSTLSTGLNKREAFIKDNAIDIHMRELNFKNNKKIYLNKDTIIPTGKGIKCYIHCLTIGYFENYQICHHTLSIWVCLCDGTIKIASILPSSLDRNGLLPELSKI